MALALPASIFTATELQAHLPSHWRKDRLSSPYINRNRRHPFYDRIYSYHRRSRLFFNLSSFRRKFGRSGPDLHRRQDVR